ncbi:hypothetical protein PAMP_000093 [Pampus punctatissimus]
MKARAAGRQNSASGGLRCCSGHNRHTQEVEVLHRQHCFITSKGLTRVLRSSTSYVDGRRDSEH